MKRVVAVAALVALVFAFASLALAGERREIVSKRTEYAKVFGNGDGTCTAEIKNYPVHKKGVRGDWVEIADIERGVGKAAVNSTLGNGATVTACHAWFHSSLDPYFDTHTYSKLTSGDFYTSAGSDTGTGLDYTSWEYMTSYNFYLAAIVPPDITVSSAYYVINSPYSSDYNYGFSVYCLPYNPLWTDAQTLIEACTGSNYRCSNSDSFSSPVTISYSGMSADIENYASSGVFVVAHMGGGNRNRIGNSATLYFTWTEGARKSIARSSEADETDISISAMPNPFNPVTTIQFSLPVSSNVSVDVYSITGQKVASLFHGNMVRGNHSVQFNGTGLASGTYFCRIATSKSVKTEKILLMK